MTTLQNRGRTSYHAGLAAEDIVATRYARQGCPVLATRWRRSHARAASRLTQRQFERIYGAGSEFLATQPRGQLTDVRIDFALVDETGRVDVIENAYMAA